MARKVSALRIRHLKRLETIVNNHLKSPQTVVFNHSTTSSRFSLHAISDASMGTSNDAARGGFVIFRRNVDTVHPICWNAHKLRRVSRSSSTAELLAASYNANMPAYIQSLLKELLYRHPVELTVDSRALFDLSTTVHEPFEPLNKIDLAAIRQMYNPSQIDSISWSPSHYNVSDALTKNNLTTADLPLKILREGQYAHHPDHLVHTAEQPLEVSDDVTQTGAC